MKILATCSIAGRGDAVFTDEAFSALCLERARQMKKIRVAEGDRIVELEIKSAEAARKENREVLAFLVKPIEDEAIREFILNRDIVLL